MELGIFVTIFLVITKSCRADFGQYQAVDLTHVQDDNAKGGPGFGPLFKSKVLHAGIFRDVPDQW